MKQRIDARIEPALLADVKAAIEPHNLTFTAVLEEALRMWLRAFRRKNPDKRA